MNELLFLTQSLLIVLFALAALRIGKEALTAWVIIQALIANLFVVKQISLFGFEVTASDAYSIGSLLGLSFLQQYFGKEEAQKATWTCFLFLLFFVFISQLHLLYEPNSSDVTQGAFLHLFSASPRLLMASLVSFFISQRIDLVLFSLLQKPNGIKNFTVRALLTLLCAQCVDTVLFSFLALYGVVASLINIISLSMLIKSLVIFFITPFMRWAKT